MLNTEAAVVSETVAVFTLSEQHWFQSKRCTY